MEKIVSQFEDIRLEFEEKKYNDGFKEIKKVFIFDQEFNMTLGMLYLNSLIFKKLHENNYFNLSKGVLSNFIYLVDGSKGSMKDYLVTIKEDLFDNGYNIDQVKDILNELRKPLATFALSFDAVKSYDISMYDFVSMARESDRMREIICDFSFDKNMSAYEVMETKERLSEEVKNYVLKNKIEPFHAYIGAQATMRLAQFFDIVVGIGIRASGDGIYPHTICESWLTGLRDPDSFWIEQDVARNAAVVSKLDISSTGTFGKRHMTMNQHNHLHPDPEYKCDSIHCIPIEINKSNAEFMIGTYYYPEPNKLKRIEKEDINSLMGKTINSRSPITCNSDDVCRYCIGDRLYFDKLKGYGGTNYNLGVATSLDIITPKTQDVLSFKHNVIATLISLELVDEGSGEIYEDYELSKLDHIRFPEVISISIDDFHVNTNKEVVSKSIRIKFKNGLEKVLCSENPFYTGIENFNQETCILLDDSLLRIKIPNKPKTAGFYELTKIFGAKYKTPIETLDALHKLFEGDHPLMVHFMARQIFRDTEDVSKRPDFSKDNPQITISSILSVIKKSHQLSLKLGVGFFGDMIKDIGHYDPNKMEPSRFDVLFRSRKNK